MCVELSCPPDSKRPGTSVLVVDLESVEADYRAVCRLLPGALVYYAIDPKLARPVLRRLAALGCRFEVAGIAEARAVLQAGTPPDRLSFGSAVEEAEVAEAFRLGVRLFAFGSEAELARIARVAPGARVSCRVRIGGMEEEAPRARTSGCTPVEAVELLHRAPALGLKPWGLSCQMRPDAAGPEPWDRAIRVASGVFRALEKCGLRLPTLNLGGALPATYRRPTPQIGTSGERILASLREHFGPFVPGIVVEAGRGV